MDKILISELRPCDRKNLIEFLEEQIADGNIEEYGLSKDTITVNGQTFKDLETLDERVFI